MATTLVDLLKGVATELVTPLRDAVMAEVNDGLERIDRELRDPEKARTVVREFFGGVREAWRKCSHGEIESRCEKCSPR